MGIEEFMMYYGQQELTKLQKQEMMNLEDGVDHDLFSGIETGDGKEDENAEHVDIDVLKARIKEQSARKK